jgi:hypothetical protein
LGKILNKAIFLAATIGSAFVSGCCITPDYSTYQPKMGSIPSINIGDDYTSVKTKIESFATAVSLPETTDLRYCPIRPQGAKRITLFHDNLADDAVGARSTIWFFYNMNGFFELIQISEKHKCRRAADPDAWTTALCP